MTRGIYHINFYIFISNGCVFTEDGDATFFFKVVAIHYKFAGFLIVAENFSGVQDFVNQGSFTMVNVCNDCNVADFHKGAKVRFCNGGSKRIAMFILF